MRRTRVRPLGQRRSVALKGRRRPHDGGAVAGWQAAEAGEDTSKKSEDQRMAGSTRRKEGVSLRQAMQCRQMLPAWQQHPECEITLSNAGQRALFVVEEQAFEAAQYGWRAEVALVIVCHEPLVAARHSDA